MAIQWTKDLSVGIIWSDNQHKTLIKIINDLIDAISRGEVWIELVNIVKFLEKYIVTHFTSEEKYMLTYNYSGYEYN